MQTKKQAGRGSESMIACRHEKSEPEEELAAVGLAAPTEEGAELRKQHREGSSRQGALRRDPPARPFTRLAQACCKINTRMLQKRYMQEQWHVLVAVASFVVMAAWGVRVQTGEGGGMGSHCYPESQY